MLGLLVLGLVNLHSATAASQRALFTRQLYFLGGGFLLFIAAAAIDYRVFYRMAYPLYACGLGMLILVLLFGRRINGARRWFELGPLRLQPSEIMKILVVLAIAKYLHDEGAPRAGGAQAKGRFQFLSRSELVLLAMLFVPVVLTMKQPDLGTGLILGLIGFSVLAVARYQVRTLLYVAGAGLLMAPIAWFGLMRPYQKERILIFLDPSRDPVGAGWHTRQAIFAVGSGRLTGKGFLHGTQNQLQFLPEHWTDFPFAVWAEEWGFLGCFVLCTIYLFVIVWALGIASSARDKFGALCALGIAGLLFWHVFLNIGMVTGLVPVVGVTLPLVSYGGSSVLTMMVGLGLLMNVSIRRHAH
jgi:rod shape determining protein RodA